MIGSKPAQLVRLALFDLAHEWAISVCQVTALAAILAPLLVLYGLQQGVIGTLIERMDRDPAMRAIVPDVSGANRFDAAWFAAMRARADVDFVMANTRAIAGQVDLLPKEGTVPAPVRISLLPTAPGDPVGGGGPALADGLGIVSISRRVADKLGVKPGDQVVAGIERTRGGRIEPVSLTLTIRAIVPAERYDGLAAFATLALLEAVQNYRDGFAVPALGWGGDGAAPAVKAYPLFRLYARTIGDVAAIAGDLRAQGIAVSTREGEIASALALRRNLSIILVIIAGLGACGYLVSLAASQWASASRKRREMAILALLGYTPGWLVGFPVAQAAAIASAGTALAAMLFSGVAAAINLYFSQSIATGERACHLGPRELLVCALVTIAVSLLPAWMTGAIYGRLEVSEELRDV
ncbi:MAG: AbrB/MazE/SpoVT family DNA-binding domain-containing protein [Rhodospirillales bacterium]|nr:AbrB/MazE/SpoVT family DNA-binding domain-containing protein [Rhodospirillales bacterium]